MAHHGQATPRAPLQSKTSTSSLSRISTVSDITDFDTYGDGFTASPATIHGQPSLVSLQSNDEDQARSRSADDIHTYSHSGAPSGWAGFTGYSPKRGYEPVLAAANQGPPPHRKKSRGFGHSKSSSSRKHHETIPEEEDGIDLGLLKAAAPMSHEPQFPIDKDSPAFDLTSVLGPSTTADDAFLKTLQDQEAQGKPTGGLGLGLRPDAIVTESALLANSPLSEKPPWAQAFGSTGRQGLSRRDTVKQLAQSEANKQGKVIEVIIEEEPSQSDVDLSLMDGPDTGLSGHHSMRKSTFPRRKTATEVYYPQPNWKPFSMRWPYLLLLIITSIVLGGFIELIYQRSSREPLVSFRSPSEIPGVKYFAFKFLPTLITVSYGVMWQITDFEVRRLEAFFQLSKEGGALAAESINVDYITSFSFFRPFRAIQCKHYAVAVSSIASLLANAAVPTLGAACIFLSPDREARLKNPDDEKHILVHHVWSRFLMCIFFVIAILGCLLFYQLESRRSGLLADVRGIAGLASMATVSHILMDFKDMDVATHEDIHHKLKDHRYVLRNSSLAPDDLHPPSKQEMTKYTKNHLSQNPHPLMLRTQGAVPFITGIALFLVLLPILLFTPARIIADRAPWIVTALAVCIKLSWGALETDVRMMEPYYILSGRHAPPKTLTLDYTAMPFGWVVYRGMMNGHWLVFFAGFGTVMTELLTVLVTSLATVEGRVFAALINKDGKHQDQFESRDHDEAAEGINSGQETAVSFWISLALAAFILAYMGVVAGVVFTKRRRVFLPRQPNTIASVLAFIHQSKMLYDFVGTAKLSNAEMVKKLEGIGKRYGLGWFQGRDGQSHCGVDEEELLSGYKFGYDYSRATKPWEEGEVNWL